MKKQPTLHNLGIWSSTLALAALLVLAACKQTTIPTTNQPPSSTISSPAPAPTPTPTAGVTIDLTAQNLAFNTNAITVPSGAAVTVNFSNKDAVNHNFAVYQILAGGQTKPVFVGGIISGSQVIVYRFTAPAETGDYFFECDVHPQNMNGKFIVAIP